MRDWKVLEKDLDLHRVFQAMRSSKDLLTITSPLKSKFAQLKKLNKSQMKENVKTKTTKLLSNFLLKLKEIKHLEVPRKKKSEGNASKRPSIHGMSSKLPLNVNCLAMIGKLKKKQRIKSIIKKRHFRIKSILNGNKNENLVLKKVDWSRCMLFELEWLKCKSGPIVSISFNEDIQVLIGNALCIFEMKG